MANFSERKVSIMQICIVFCVPVLLYLQTIKFGFSGFDDNRLILTNAAFLGDIKNIAKAFSTDAFIDKTTPFYRPLQTLTYMIDIKLAGGISAAIFHLTNVILLGFISCSLFLVLKKFLVPSYFAMSAALLYCAHPLFIASIAWIPARGDLLLTLFALLSLIFLSNYLHTEAPLQLFMHWLTFMLALFCKETAAVLPAIFIAYYVIVFDHKPLKIPYPAAIAGYVVTGLLWYGVRSTAIFNAPSANAVFGLKAFLANVRAIPESLASFFIPYNIAPIPGFSSTKTIIGIVIIVAIVTLFILKKVTDNKAGLFCLCWFTFLLLPTLLFKHHLIDYLNHRFLLPLIGILIFTCLSIPKKWLGTEATGSIRVFLPVILFLSYYTFVASVDYADPISFYSSALSMNPKSALAYNNRGSFKVNGNDLKSAIDDFNQAIQIYPEYEEAFNNRGVAKLMSGDNTGSIVDFDTAITINSSFPDPYYRRGIAYYNLFAYNRAISDFTSYASLSKVHLDEYNYIGKSLAQLGSFQEALKYFDKAIAINPRHQLSYINRAIARYNVQDYAGVIEDCDKGLALQANDINAQSLKAKALNKLKESSLRS